MSFLSLKIDLIFFVSTNFSLDVNSINVLKGLVGVNLTTPPFAIESQVELSLECSI